MNRRRWMALCFALGSLCFFIGPFPGVRKPRRRLGRRRHLLRRLDPVHGRRSASKLARVAGAASARRRPPGLVGRSHPVRRHAVLQRNHLPGHAHRPDEPRIQQARLAARLVRLDLLPGLGCDRLPRVTEAWLATRPRGCGMVAARRQPARLHLLRNLGGRRLRRPLDRLNALPGRVQLEHLAGRRVLPGLRARHLAHRRGLEDATTSPASRARARS